MTRLDAGAPGVRCRTIVPEGGKFMQRPTETRREARPCFTSYMYQWASREALPVRRLCKADRRRLTISPPARA